MDDKDRLGDKLRDKEKAQEDEYFARRDRELLEKLRQERRQQSNAATAPMTCPRCGTQLVERVQHDVTLDECPSCGGVWFDKGELAHLAERQDEGWMGRWLREWLPRR
ncbi:MAG: zf-TFIIB domain-containing protein [bacterium]